MPEPITDPVPAHVPAFKLREWVGRQYIFDGDEPIAWINPKESGMLQEVKLVPGLMPMLIFQPGVQFGQALHPRLGAEHLVEQVANLVLDLAFLPP